MADFDSDTIKPLPVEPVRLIAIDLDGSLLRSDGTIGESTVAAVREASAQGIRVVLATARPPRGVIASYQKLALDTVQVNHNGALVYDARQRKVIEHLPIDASLARQVVSIARQIAPKIPIGVDVIDTLYCDKSNNSNNDLNLSHAGVTSAAGLLEPVLNEPVTKVFMTGEPHELAHIQMTLHEKLRARVAFATSHLKLLQVVAEGVDKAVGLARVAGMYDVPAQSVMAIGDAPNDLGMFKWAGLAVAVKNAWRDVLKAAHFAVPSNDEDGVGEAIRRFALS